MYPVLKCLFHQLLLLFFVAIAFIDGADSRPNILVILADDLGYSDIGCFGGEIDTPHLDRLASNGIRYTNFYNTSKCWTTRASLLTGNYWQKVTVGNGLKPDSITIADRLKDAGYETYLSGKWHLDENKHEDPSRYPGAFGFDHFFGNLHGAVSYYNPYTLTRDNKPATDEIREGFYLTDAISDEATKNIKDHFRNNKDTPLFLYLAYTAPHWPLQAFPEDIAKYEPRYAGKSFEEIRKTRFKKMHAMGLLPVEAVFSKAMHQSWTSVDQVWNSRRMAVFAAMVDRMDRGIGQVLVALEETNQLENTVICFMADNGASPELIGQNNGLSCLGGEALTRDGKPIKISGNEMPGDETTFQGYGPDWANVSNTPYRYYKTTSYEGGIRSPFILHWPKGVSDSKQGSIDQRLVSHLIDISPTFLELAGQAVPEEMDGVSLKEQWQGNGSGNPKRILFNDFSKGSMMNDYPWKFVAYKEDSFLYNLETDPTETKNLREKYPQRFAIMSKALAEWKASFEN